MTKFLKIVLIATAFIAVAGTSGFIGNADAFGPGKIVVKFAPGKIVVKFAPGKIVVK